ncbi:MAG: hypothetical protein ACRDDX_08240 [Cellulosilyticaceae bacterium]
MLEELKAELRQGKKTYIFQGISILLFAVFLGFGVEVLAAYAPPIVLNGSLFLWLGINLVVMSCYAIYSFIKILLKEEQLIKTPSKTVLYKVLMFLICFSISGFIFLQTTGMAIPIIALGITYLVLVSASSTSQSKKILMVAGLMWFWALFIILYFTAPIVCMVLYNLIKSTLIVEMIINVLLIALSIVIYIGVIKKLTDHCNA